MEGYDSKWQYTENQNFAHYNNLPSGTYHFKLRSTNANGIWNKEVKTLEIEIENLISLSGEEIKNISDFNDNVSFDENHAKNFGEYSLEYLRGISPKYNRERLTKALLPKVSGDFYVDIYQPIQNVLHEYEYWMKKEKYFKSSIETFPNSLRVMQKPEWTITELKDNHKQLIDKIKQHYKI